MNDLYYGVGEAVLAFIIGIPVTLFLVKLGQWFLIFWEDIFGEEGKRLLFTVIKWGFALGVIGFWIFYAIIPSFFKKDFISLFVHLIIVIGFISEFKKFVK